MDPGADQYRLAIAAFDDPESLWSAIRTLVGAGFSAEQFCLVALATKLAVITLPERIPGAPRDLLEAMARNVEDWPNSSNGSTGDGQMGAGDRIVATAGQVSRSLLPAPSAGDGDGGQRQGHISDQHRSELEAHVLQGAIVLVVKSSNPAQQWMSTRTLLDHSSHSVKTYEFAVPAGSGQPGTDAC